MLDGKVCVVTGAAGALGNVVAATAAGYGAEVVLVDVVPDFTTDLGRYLCVDLTDSDAVAEAMNTIGRIDMLANIAGGFDMGPTVYETDDAMWDAMFTINVTTLRTMLRHAVPVMLGQGRGSIINVGALGALQGAGNMSAYTAAKSTVMRLTESLSAEVKHQGVNVNAILPSLIDTPRNRADMPDADFDTWVTPADLAEVVCFLGSDRARVIHGALVPVAGVL